MTTKHRSNTINMKKQDLAIAQRKNNQKKTKEARPNGY